MTKIESGNNGKFAPFSRARRGRAPLGVGARPLFESAERVASPAAPVEPPTASGSSSAAGGREGAYPVPGRSALLNTRIAGHETGHALCARAVGSVVHSVTIVPHGQFAGRCIRSGAPSALALQIDADDRPPLTGQEVVDICARLEALTPEIGSCRVADAEYIIRSQCAAIELVGARICEAILHPGLPPLNSDHDTREALALARIAAATRSAACDLVAYAEAEAAGLIRENIDVALALVAALIANGTLTGEQVDRVIVDAVGARAQAAELRRRADWHAREASAKKFLAVVETSAPR